MKTKIILLTLAFGFSPCLLKAQDTKPAPGGQSPPPPAGGQGGPGLHLLPREAQEKLNLTAEQQKQVVALEAEVKAKLEKILTPDQLEQLKQIRPPQGQRGPGGPQGGPGGQQGGPGGQQGGPGGPQGGAGAQQGGPKNPAPEK